MQSAKNSEANRAAEVEPAIRHMAPWRAVSVTALPDYRLRVTFVDGTTGEVDMRRFLNKLVIDGTIFEPMRDMATFSQVQVVLGVIQWPNGADLAPDVIYDTIREQGVWIVD